MNFAIDEATRRVPSLDPVAMRLVLSLHRLTSALVYDLESSVHRPQGWSWAGFRVLFVLWLAGPLEAGRVATLSGMSRAAVSALIVTLRRRGLVTRDRSSHDGRAAQVALAPAGKRAIARAFRLHNARERAWTETLTRPEQRRLIELLGKLMLGSETVRKKRF